VHHEHRILFFFQHIPLVRKFVLFSAQRTALVLQTLEVADQLNKTDNTYYMSSAWFLCTYLFNIYIYIYIYMCVCVCETISKSFTALSASGPTHSVRRHRGIQRHCRHAHERWSEFELYVPNSVNFFAPLYRVSAAKILCAIITRWAQ
jgi:hypothetical protein